MSAKNEETSDEMDRDCASVYPALVVGVRVKCDEKDI
jgi:hypothetical protein